LKNSNSPSKGNPSIESLDLIVQFLEAQNSFQFSTSNMDISIIQLEDKKLLKFAIEKVEKVLERIDYDGSQFLQVNFKSGLKLLITKNLIGFKPNEIMGFDTTKIPKVVTTVDLVSITKAIEDISEDLDGADALTEMEVLKKVYQSILYGAVAVGFEMQTEKDWFANYLLNSMAASA
jgi:hypothetical protein